MCVCVCVHCVVRRPRARITSGGSERVLVVEDGERLQLRCRVYGRPRPDVTWLKDGQTLHNDDTRHITRTRSALLACLVTVCNKPDVSSQHADSDITRWNAHCACYRLYYLLEYDT